MNLAQLHYFRKLAQLEHYTKAAHELFISQPSLSASIASMEEELHIKLFQKKGRNVQLTKDGREFYDYVCKALDTLQDGIDIAQERSGSLCGTIDIACIPSLLVNFIPNLIHAYRKAGNPHTKFRLYNALSSTGMVQGLKENAYDFGFCDTPLNGFLSFPIHSQRIMAWVSKAHPFAKKTSLSLSDLSSFPFMTGPDSSPIGEAVQEILQQHGLTPEMSFEEDLLISGYLAQDNNAIVLAPENDLLASCDLIAPIPIAEMSREIPCVYLVYSKDSHITRSMERFLSYLQGQEAA